MQFQYLGRDLRRFVASSFETQAIFNTQSVKILPYRSVVIKHEVIASRAQEFHLKYIWMLNHCKGIFNKNQNHPIRTVESG